MQVLLDVINEEEDIPNKPKKSSYSILVNNILIESINELNLVQSEISELQKRSALLEIKNQKIIENIKTILENFNSHHYVIDSCTQSQKIELHDISVDCDIQPILPVIPEKIDKSTCNIEEIQLENDEIIEDQNIQDEIIETFDDTNKQPEPILSITEETKTEIKPVLSDPLQTYTKDDMLAYLAKYKIDFLKFLQCNRNNIEQIAGGCPELIRSLSYNSSTDDNPKSSSKRKPSDKSSHSRQKYKTKSNTELKPGVIDTGDHLEDPSLKSSLYDDLDFSETPDRVEIRHTDTGHSHPVAAPPGIAHSDLIKMGGEKRLNAIGVQSKMNLLKSRASDSVSSSKQSSHKSSSGSSMNRKKSSTTASGSGTGTSASSQWKNEITHLKSQHEAHYPDSVSSSLPLATEHQQAQNTMTMMKPLETVFTSRMRERLKRPAPDHGGPSPLPVVKYDLSTPDDPSFELDSKPYNVPLNVPPTVSSGKSTSTTEVFSTRTSHHSSSIITPTPISTTSISSIPCVPLAETNHSHESDSRPSKHVSYSKSTLTSSSSASAELVSHSTPNKLPVVASSSSSNHHHNSRDKSKHKHKHSSKKRTKKPSKDLEDGEIV